MSEALADAPSVTHPHLHIVELQYEAPQITDADTLFSTVLGYPIGAGSLNAEQTEQYFEETLVPLFDAAVTARNQRLGIKQTERDKFLTLAAGLKPMRLLVLWGNEPARVAELVGKPWNEVVATMQATVASLDEESEGGTFREQARSAFESSYPHIRPALLAVAEEVSEAPEEAGPEDLSTEAESEQDDVDNVPAVTAVAGQIATESVTQKSVATVTTIASRPPALGVNERGRVRPTRAGSRPTATRAEADYDATGDFLKRVGKVALLDAEQEVELAKRIEAGVLAGEVIQKAQASGEVIPPQRLRDLRRVQRDGEHAYKHMVLANMRLVLHIARKHQGKGMVYDDLVQEGSFGLMHAVEMFDFAKGFKFSTYASNWIHQTITRAIADKARTIRVPVHTVEKLNKLARVRNEMRFKYGREATHDELAEAMEVTPEKLTELVASTREVTSLNAMVGEDLDTELGDFVADRTAIGVEDTVVDSMPRGNVMDLLRTVLADERELDVLLRRSGYYGEKETFDSIADYYELSRQRTQQIHKAARARLARSPKFKQLHELMD